MVYHLNDLHALRRLNRQINETQDIRLQVEHVNRKSKLLSYLITLIASCNCYCN